MRHAYAGMPKEDPEEERDRPLTAEGRRLARAVAEAVYDTGDIPSVIFTSPFKRAQETADEFARRMCELTDEPLAVNAVGDFAPDRSIVPGIGDIAGYKRAKRVMVVGHVDNTGPGMNELGGDEKWRDLVKGEIRLVKLNRKSLRWREVWCIKPSDLGFDDALD